MKKIMIGIVMITLLLAGFLPSQSTVEAAIQRGSLTDKNLSNYAMSENFKVTKGVMYFKNEKGQFVKPSTIYIKNTMLQQVTKGSLDKERFTFVNYERKDGIDTVYIIIAPSYMASIMGYKPISYQFYTSKKKTIDKIKNVRIFLSLEYDFYDVKTNKFNSPIYKTELKSSLINIFGKKDGEAIYKHVNGLREKYRNNLPDINNPVNVSKRFGKIGVHSSMTDTKMYVEFSY